MLELTFSTPLAAGAEKPDAWQVRTWEIDRTQEYGSPHRDEQDRAIESAALSADGRTITLTVPGFAATRCYALSWQLPSADGSLVKGSLNGTLH